MKKYAIALDIGGTNIKYALIDDEGKIEFESIKSSKTEDKDVTSIDYLKEVVSETMQYADNKNLNVIGIGIGVPSIVDNGVVLFANNLPEINGLNLEDALGSFFGLPVFVENDANLMALGEYKFGIAKGSTDIVFLTVGTGIGGALIANGKLYGGYRNRGMELGHIIINNTDNARECTCGSKGCMEAYAATSVLIRDYVGLLKKNGKAVEGNVDGRYIVEKYHSGETEAVQIMDAHFDAMGIGVASLINVFAPEKFIIGGGISEAGDFYIKNIQEVVGKYVMNETSSFTTIASASLGNKAGFLGAAAFVFEKE